MVRENTQKCLSISQIRLDNCGRCKGCTQYFAGGKVRLAMCLPEEGPVAFHTALLAAKIWPGRKRYKENSLSGRK